MVDTSSFWDCDARVVGATEPLLAATRKPVRRILLALAIVAVVALTLALSVAAVAAPGPIISTPGYDTTMGPVGDDVTTYTALPFTINFLGNNRSEAWLCSNGFITLDGDYDQYDASTPLAGHGYDMIAPFFTDLRSEGPTGTYSFGVSEWNGRTTFSTNWIESTHYEEPALHTFQVVLVDRSDLAPGDFDMIFNYSSIPTGTEDHYYERVGWSNAAGTDWYEFPGSGVAGPLHDEAPTGLIHHGTNDVPGRYYFTSRAGAMATDTVPPVDPVLSSSTATDVPSNVQTITVDLAGATDGLGTGVDGFAYSWSMDDTETPPAVKSLEQTATSVTAGLGEGTWWFNLRTVDAAGNWTSTAHLGPFMIDLTPPTTTDDYSPPYVGSAVISLDATDTGGSGVDYTRWRIDGSALETGTVAATDTVGFHMLEYFSVDVAGNVETTNTLLFQIWNDPTAFDDDYVMPEDDVFIPSAPVTWNDLIATYPVSAVLDSSTSNGDLFWDGTGMWFYVPDPDFFGTDYFTYHLSNANSDSNVATVTIDVFNVEDDPAIVSVGGYSVSSSLTTSTPEDTMLNIGAVHAEDVDGDALFWSFASQPVYGQVSLTATASTDTDVSYMPDQDFNGTDSFTLAVTDDTGRSDLLLVTVVVTPVNDAPVGVPDDYTILEDGVLDVGPPGPLTNDTDVDGDPLTIDIGTWAFVSGDFGSWGVSNQGWLQYIPSPDWSGTTVFSYAPRDGFVTGTATTITIDVTPVNDAPDDIDLSNSDIDENMTAGSVVGTVTANDIDSTTFEWSVEGTDAASFEIVGDELLTTEQFDHESQSVYEIDIVVEDDQGASYSEPFTITVNDVNDAPEAVADSYLTAEDTTLTVAAPGILDNDDDDDGDSLTVVLGPGPYNGSLDASLTSGGFSYVPDGDWFGTDSFDYSVTDGVANSTTVTVEIEVTPVNDVPIAADDAYGTPQDVVLTVGSPGILSNDFDVEGPLWAALESAAAYGTVNLTANGSFTYTPPEGWSGVDTFTYRATDGADSSSPATVTITVSHVDTTYRSVAGANRIATAIRASRMAFPAGADDVVVCTGYNWPDALGGSALAGALDGPVLLTRPGALPSEVLGEIRRLGADRAIILGSSTAVSGSVMTALRNELGTPNVRRIGGVDRYDTARRVAAEVVSVLGGSFDGTALAATGADFPDALSASPLSAGNGWPLYLVKPGSSAVSLRTAMQSHGVTKLIILGNSTNVTTAAQQTLGATGIVTTRISGSDRYTTCAAIASYGVNKGGLAWDNLSISRGDDFPDALSGGVFAARMGSVLLMTPPTTLHRATARVLTNNRNSINRVYFVGDTSAVSQKVRDDVASLLR